MKQIVYIIMILCLATPAFAEPRAYFDMEPGFFSGGPKIYVDGKPAPMSWGKYNLEQAMASNPTAAEYARKYERDSSWATGLVWGGLGVAAIYLWTSRDDNRIGTYWAIFAVGLAGSVVFEKRAMSHLYKAINSYNGVSEKPSARVQLQLVPLASRGAINGAAAGVALSF